MAAISVTGRNGRASGDDGYHSTAHRSLSAIVRAAPAAATRSLPQPNGTHPLNYCCIRYLISQLEYKKIDKYVPVKKNYSFAHFS